MRSALFVAVATLTPNIASAEDCRSITESTARLACFDKSAPNSLIPSTPKSAKKAAPADGTTAAKAMVQRKLSDPESARFQDMFVVPTANEGSVICGLVNSRNRMGGYDGNRGFIYEPTRKRATIMATGDSDPDYAMDAAAAYCVHCAPDPRSDRSFNSFCPSMLKFRR